MSDIDNQFSISGIQFSILVLPRHNFERFLKPYGLRNRSKLCENTKKTNVMIRIETSLNLDSSEFSGSEFFEV